MNCIEIEIDLYRDVADDGDADAGRAADAGAVRCIPGVPGHRRRLLLGRGHVQLLPLDHLQNKADDVDPPPVSSVRLFMHAFSATYQCINDRSMKSIDPLQLHCNWSGWMPSLIIFICIDSVVVAKSISEVSKFDVMGIDRWIEQLIC